MKVLVKLEQVYESCVQKLVNRDGSFMSTTAWGKKVSFGAVECVQAYYVVNSA